MAIFLLVMALVAWDRSVQQNRPPDPLDAKAGSTSMFASEIAGKEKDGFVAPAKAAAPVLQDTQPPPDAVIVARQDDLEAPPRPPGGTLPMEEQRGMDERERLHAASQINGQSPLMDRLGNRRAAHHHTIASGGRPRPAWPGVSVDCRSARHIAAR